MTTPRGHAEVRRDLAAYTVGALSPTERADVDAHLPSCRACRDELAELAGLPGLLARLTPDEVAAHLEVRPGEEEQLAAAAAKRVRAVERRWRLSAVASAAAALLFAVLYVTSPHDGTAGTSFRGVPVAAAAEASDVVATVSDRRWGMAVTLHAAGLPDRRGYALEAVGVDGHRTQVASWAHTGAAVELEGACYMSVADATTLEIVTDGEVIVAIPLADERTV